MNIPVDKLKSFVLIAEERNLTRAAVRRHSTPAAVSAQIRQLEHAIGFKLFERTTGGMLLTEAGQKVLPLAYQVVANLDEFKSAAKAIAANSRKHLLLGLNALPELLKMDSIFKMASELLPEVSLVIKSSNSLANQHDVIRRQLDAGFVAGAVDHPELRREKLGHIDLAIIAPPSFTTGQRFDRLEALLSHPWVFPSKQCTYYETLENMFEGIRHKIRVVAVSDDQYSTLTMVKSGLGLGVVEMRLAKLSSAPGDIQIIHTEPMHLPLYLVVRNDRYESFGELKLIVSLIRSQWLQKGKCTFTSTDNLQGPLLPTNSYKELETELN